jgi:hypothetical protein
MTSKHKKEDNVIHINYGQRQVAKQLLKELQKQKEKDVNSIPYGDWIKKMNTKFMINGASNFFIENKIKGMENEQATIFAKDVIKSEGIRYMALEILKVASLYKEGQLTNAHMNNLELLAKDFVQQAQFMDRNNKNKFTHFLSDMEMLHDLSEERRQEILKGKKR